MSVSAWFVMMALWITVVIWMTAQVFRDADGISGLFSLFCFPYAIRHAYRLRADNPWPLRLLGVAALGAGGWLAFLLGDLVHPVELVSMPPDKRAEISMLLAIIGAELLLMTVFAGMVVTGVMWLAMIAFDREGWRHGFIAVLFWPYALYYGISKYSMNRAPVVIGLVGLGGLILVSLVSAIWPAYFS